MLPGVFQATRHRIGGHFLAMHAISREDAIPYRPEAGKVGEEFARMRKARLIHEAGAGTFWLDWPAYRADRERFDQRLATQAGIGAVILALALMAFYYL